MRRSSLMSWMFSINCDADGMIKKLKFDFNSKTPYETVSNFWPFISSNGITSPFAVL